MEQVQTKTQSQLSVKEPNPYIIIFHNNNLTTMEGVILLLERIFNYPYDTAIPLMVEVHDKGQATVWEGPQDVAHQLYGLALTFCHEAPELFGLLHLRIELKEKPSV